MSYTSALYNYFVAKFDGSQAILPNKVLEFLSKLENIELTEKAVACLSNGSNKYRVCIGCTFYNNRNGSNCPHCTFKFITKPERVSTVEFEDNAQPTWSPTHVPPQPYQQGFHGYPQPSFQPHPAVQMFPSSIHPVQQMFQMHTGTAPLLRGHGHGQPAIKECPFGANCKFGPKLCRYSHKALVPKLNDFDDDYDTDDCEAEPIPVRVQVPVVQVCNFGWACNKYGCTRSHPPNEVIKEILSKASIEGVAEKYKVPQSIKSSENIQKSVEGLIFNAFCHHLANNTNLNIVVSNDHPVMNYLKSNVFIKQKGSNEWTIRNKKNRWLPNFNQQQLERFAANFNKLSHSI
jgi:hypothetical protein